jgi:hypothetical protein
VLLQLIHEMNIPKHPSQPVVQPGLFCKLAVAVYVSELPVPVTAAAVLLSALLVLVTVPVIP